MAGRRRLVHGHVDAVIDDADRLRRCTRLRRRNAGQKRSEKENDVSHKALKIGAGRSIAQRGHHGWT
jgi:hypothetical protein